ncbi:MAG: PIG-L family deacetylase [Candidatus Helarchaeota archaeon]|nr:PIG-L family deacetylase [Candidatus Helarchaeota archaeon]
MVLTRIIFAPHEDDAVLSSGGLILQSVAEGINVVIVYMTDGSACYLVNNIDVGKTLKEVATIRKREALQCCEVLSVPICNIQFLDFPDQHLNKPENFDSALEIVKIILRSYSNVEAFIPVGKNPHIDHQITHDIVINAVEEIGQNNIPIYQYGLHKSVIGKADLKVKLTPKMLEMKIKAYNCHLSQKFIKVNDIAAQNDEERFKLVER